jgi:hypothetical protein
MIYTVYTVFSVLCVLLYDDTVWKVYAPCSSAKTPLQYSLKGYITSGVPAITMTQLGWSAFQIIAGMCVGALSCWFLQIRRGVKRIDEVKRNDDDEWLFSDEIYDISDNYGVADGQFKMVFLFCIIKGDFCKIIRLGFVR